MQYFVLDIETCPANLEGYELLSDEEQRKLLNPIDSRIIAIGLRHDMENIIMLDQDERALLTSFWQKWELLRKDGRQVVGFNITTFDIPFLVVRSFINNVKISPFTVKYIIDLREKVNAYRPQPSRGTLKEFAAAMGIDTLGDGSQVPFLCKNKQWEKLQQYLMHDLFITDAMYHRLKELNIIDIQKW